MIIVDYGVKRLKMYKGYNIDKIWDITSAGKKVNIQYQVSDNDENAIDFFCNISRSKEVHRYSFGINLINPTRVGGN